MVFWTPWVGPPQYCQDSTCHKELCQASTSQPGGRIIFGIIQAKATRQRKKAQQNESDQSRSRKMAVQWPVPPSSTEDTGKSAQPSKTSPAKETPKKKEQAQESSLYESSSSSSSSSDAPEAPQEEEEPDQKEETEQSSEESNTPDLT